MDNKILLTIIEKFGGGPVGLNTIATAVSEDAGTIEEVYEPFLIKEGFLKRTPRGREATETAMHISDSPGRTMANSPCSDIKNGNPVDKLSTVPRAVYDNFLIKARRKPKHPL